MIDWLRRSVTKQFLQNPLGERIRRGGGFTRVGALTDRFMTSETRQIARARQALALAQTVQFIEQHLPTVPSFASPFSVLREGVRAAQDVPGLLLEFGVREGYTLNWITRLTERTVYGFDSFEGLPEHWTSVYRRGAFKVQALPKVRKNVVLVRGLFDESLPSFLATHPEKLAFVHIDSDLYSSAVSVFKQLAGRFQPGTVIVFDEFFNYPGWQRGEYKAFMEFVAEHEVQYEYLAYCHFGEQLALRITGLSARP
ncbi:MAG: hypothetical protein JWN48_2296 [Myxococcaceae bacterium]|nr:hypothetical protein [Myxococcaceae bacterium]